MSAYAPFCSGLGVFDVETEFGEFVADEVGYAPVFLSFGLAAEVEQEVDGAFVGCFGFAVAFGSAGAYTEYLDEESVEEVAQTAEVVGGESGVAGSGFVDYLGCVKEVRLPWEC